FGPGARGAHPTIVSVARHVPRLAGAGGARVPLRSGIRARPRHQPPRGESAGGVTFWAADWLRAFALTLLVEIPVALPLLARAEARIGRRIAVVIVANLATHPLVWFLFPGLALGRAARLAVSEGWAVGAEIVIYL